ncbi:MAG TPA: HTH domain-containing protein, partial [Rectinemataceae bacterium]|nr:HTH domain-containing protein [Rectinemataceae bacterium]
MLMLDSLRQKRRAVSAQRLAEEMGVSLRTVYRDIESLRLLGVPVEGEAGVGYLLRSGYFMPPLVLSAEEIEAVVLGIRWVLDRGDPQLASGARSALSKLKEVLPK